MKKFVVCPDAFKGTLSAVEAAEILAAAVRKYFPEAEVCVLPLADGGEGTIDCYRRSIPGRMVSAQARNSNFRPVFAEYYLTSESAVVESAKIVGLADTGLKDPARTTTYGIGMVIKDALKHTENVSLALGGSSTNDGGTGMAAALGVRFFNSVGREFVPTGETLSEIGEIDMTGAEKFNLTCMCDVKNPLCGRNGAAYVYAPQKGADPAMVKRLDKGLSHLASIIMRDIGTDVSALKGGGAAGGAGAGAAAFFGATLKSGIETMLDAARFDEIIKGADLIITGEGRLDSQTMKGKAIHGVLGRAKKRNVPVAAVCGQIELGFDLKASGLAVATASGRPGEPLSATKDYAGDLQAAAEALFKNLSGE